METVRANVVPIYAYTVLFIALNLLDYLVTDDTQVFTVTIQT